MTAAGGGDSRSSTAAAGIEETATATADWSGERKNEKIRGEISFSASRRDADEDVAEKLQNNGIYKTIANLDGVVVTPAVGG